MNINPKKLKFYKTYNQYRSGIYDAGETIAHIWPSSNQVSTEHIRLQGEIFNYENIKDVGLIFGFAELFKWFFNNNVPFMRLLIVDNQDFELFADKDLYEQALGALYLKNNDGEVLVNYITQSEVS